MRYDERQTWDHFADSYDQVMSVLGGRYPEMIARLRRDLAGAGRVLELAAGTGLVTMAVASEVGSLVATDVSPRMIDALRDKLADARVEGVETSVQSAYALPYEDASFDAVICANALHVMESPEQALEQIHRVLRPGGVLLAPTFLHGEGIRAQLISRLMGLTRFRAHTRFSASSLADFVSSRGFEVELVDRQGGLLPLAYLRARRLD